jgi:DNA-binding NtrC family response regulator
MGYTWPGNVRELQSIINRGMVLCQKDILSFDNCEWFSQIRLSEKEQIGAERSLSGFVDELLRTGQPGVFHKAVSSLESLLVQRALELTGNNQVMAAKLLGISRNTLREKISRYRTGK